MPISTWVDANLSFQLMPKGHGTTELTVRTTKENMKSLTTVLLLSTIPISNTLAAGPGDPENDLFWKIVLIAVSVVLTGIIGYLIGTIKFFREEKHKA